MNDKINLSTSQIAELKQAMKDGGIFLKIRSDSNAKVEILESDGNGGWKTMQFLGRGISKKLYDFFGKDDIAIKAGFRTIGLSWFVSKYC